TTMYVSEDGGKTFRAQVLSGVAVPNASWTSSAHSQGANKIQVDVYNTRSIYLASSNATAGLVHVTYDASTGTWVGTKVSPGTTSLFQQVGMGLGVGDNSVPALYAMGSISDNSGSTPVAAHYGAYRSLDGGATWKRINDNQHQFGLLSALSGDSRVFGRVYIGFDGSGIRVGEVIWISDLGSDDLKAPLAVEVQSYAALGELGPSVTAQLNDALNDTQIHLQAGQTSQAIKALERFISLLTKPGVGADVYASARAQAQLEHDAQAMIATLSGS
ncbi:MAG TPA: hypothetical protein VIK32_06135, partial [Candidatus Limnocylindrales bacterium]